MPDRMHALETGLPSFHGYENTEEKVEAIQNCLYMLMEELRYLLRHLDADNFSDAGMRELAENVAEAAGGSISGAAVDPASLPEALYARFGLAAELEAYRLRTDWRRVANYLRGDRSDLHYIRIQNGEIDLVTETVTQPVSAKQLQREGQPCWWTDETRTAIGAAETPLPVMVYAYTETVAASFRYEGTPGGQLPALTFGSGTGSGLLRRDSDGLTLSYTTGEGETVSLLLSEDGYVDADKLRRPTHYDFRGIADGIIRETVDGNIIVSYAVERDALGRITLLTTPDGHETAVRW